MTRPLIRLPGWQLRLLLVVGLLLLLTGIVWLGVHYSIGAGTGELPHPLEVWCIRLHGAAAFAGLFVLGVLGGNHIPAGWRVTHHHRRGARGMQRSTGIGLVALATLMVGTGYALYYFTPEEWRPAMGWLHAGAGFAMAALALLHRRSHRRGRQVHSD
ncbi:MAG TPA: DUF4405 domain-containing protein [Ideonella sp.]|uniref:DUF4405 domain-containing protein n=1 Tax=Ideonella sp. TaxID=1929293 RepID=UPI002BBEE91B|nr:DUF4405 domain-containing protein [Ideonella sp.]HSI48478.1 DUF4405 domain-containing protein [Ideonella sp.]